MVSSGLVCVLTVIVQFLVSLSFMIVNCDQNWYDSDLIHYRQFRLCSFVFAGFVVETNHFFVNLLYISSNRCLINSSEFND
jgi:hypothetical protein